MNAAPAKWGKALVQEEIFETSALAPAAAKLAKQAVLDNKHVQESYARWAPIYDLVFALILRPGREAAAAAVGRIGGNVLDVGAGTGLELPMFDRKTRVTAIDLSEPMLRRAKERVRAKSLRNIDGLVVMDALRLAFPDAHFDAVAAPYVLTVVPEPRASLDEMARVVKTGGEIILVNHFGAGKGLIGWIESLLEKRSAKLGWRPEFPWSILGDWLAANPRVRLVERRKLPPLGLFTLTRIKKH
jgi:phosphatidylethanolamine/phosphatidyl-N-methylethanolamine N-methyltransferase